MQFAAARHIIALADYPLKTKGFRAMEFLGFFKKRGLEHMKVAEVRQDLLEVERLERQYGRQISTYRERMEGKRLYALNEKGITDGELEQMASDIEELEFDISAVNQEQSRAREEKRALKGILIVLERQERLKQAGLWERIAKMDPQDLEESLGRLGDMDASVSESVDTIRHVLGAPATPKETRQAMTPRARQILGELKSERDEG